MMDIASFTEDMAPPNTPHSTGIAYLVSRPYQNITLRGGRKMEYLILGDQSGKPMVFMPQDYGLVRWPASTEAEAERRGIKVIVPIRPGYGKSTPLPETQPPTEVISNDLNELLAHLEVDKFPILTLGADIYQALNFHRLYPDRVTAVFVTLREFQAQHPWINFTEYEDCGQLVFFKKWPEILPLIEKYL